MVTNPVTKPPAPSLTGSRGTARPAVELPDRDARDEKCSQRDDQGTAEAGTEPGVRSDGCTNVNSIGLNRNARAGAVFLEAVLAGR